MLPASGSASSHVLQILLEWKKASVYKDDRDFLFPSIRRNGKIIGWHWFRHALATNLRAMGVDIKTAQGAVAPRKQPDDTRPIHTGSLSAEAGRECAGSQNAAADSLKSLTTCAPLG